MDWFSAENIILHITTFVAIFTGILIILAAKKINKIKVEQAKIDRDISQKNLEIINTEYNNKIHLLEETEKLTLDISHQISQQLIDDPSWLDRFMDQTGATYSASVYGDRIGHFYYEKKAIAKNAINEVERIFELDKDTRYCLLIDSGTTLYPVFQEISKRVHLKKEIWKEKVCIVTNNLPGIQYLIKNAKRDPRDNYSEVIVDCFLIPGKPLAVYAAITGKESVKWVRDIKAFLKDWSNGSDNFKILCFLTGNYVTRTKENGNTVYNPAARGEGHVEIKNEMVNVSDTIFLLSPLTKFSFANVDLLNHMNKFTIERKDLENALKFPRQVKYEEIVIPEEKDVRFFVTRRVAENMFNTFSDNLYNELTTKYGSNKVSMPAIDIKRWIPNISEKSFLELDREIPHENLRKTYKPKENIWNLEWVNKQKI